jgi:hypothetical protein
MLTVWGPTDVPGVLLLFPPPQPTIDSTITSVTNNSTIHSSFFFQLGLPLKMGGKNTAIPGSPSQKASKGEPPLRCFADP